MALTASCALALGACGGAGYGEPVAGGGDGALPAGQPTPDGAPAAGGAPGTTTAPKPTTTARTTASTPAPTSTTTTSTGSGDDGGTGGSSAPSTAAYARAAGTFCSRFTSAGQSYASALQRVAGSGNPTSTSSLRQLGKATVAFSDALKQAAAALDGATPPTRYQTFHVSTLRALRGISSAIDGSRAQLLAGDSAAIARVGGRVQSSGGGSAKVPAALASRAPACKPFVG